jgi:hypothetical protein
MPQTRRRTQRQPKQERPRSLRWTPVNFALMGAGIVALAVGFLLLAQGSIVAAPLLLGLGYVVLIPLGIIA